jgi:alpha-amylase/alpha-mannosidase (GH57 family)
MNIWHLTDDAPRVPPRVSPGERVLLRVGSWPIEPGQSLELAFEVEHRSGGAERGRVQVVWERNQGENSYWRAELGPFSMGDRVRYTLTGRSLHGPASAPASSFVVGPKLHLALLWHQHQPVYRDTSQREPRGSYLHPWVRLHALRDYFSMAWMVGRHPGVHLTINLTPSLLWQLDDYLERGATDEALELGRKPISALSSSDRATILRTFFDADRHSQIAAHPRYEQLFQQRLSGKSFSDADLRDLVMWFNLAWFGKEFREGSVELPGGGAVSVQRFVEQAEGFSAEDIEEVTAEQYRLMRAIVPMHRELQDAGQLEVSTTPFFHPILPLLIDTDRATLDRPGTSLPRRFAHPEDANAQVRLAVEDYRKRFGRAPRGMWPAEGAVAQFAVPLFARHGVDWIATDRGVLARSGRYGYPVDDPDVACRPYRVEEAGHAVSIFFRDTALSDAIGFRYQHYEDGQRAARDFLQEVKERFARRVTSNDARVLGVVLDGENAWGTYPDDARPFLHALYAELEQDHEVQSVTFSEVLDGNPERGLEPSPVHEQERVYDLFTASWIDEANSAVGVDLGTWIGEEEENRAWDLLNDARAALEKSGSTPGAAPEAFLALHIAEGSDWFWWYGDDQDSGHDDEFDALFRLHLSNVYRGIGLEPPAELERRIVATAVLWTPSEPSPRLQAGDRLMVRTNCPGVLEYRIDDAAPQVRELSITGGVMGGGPPHYQLGIGPLPADSARVRFRFRCTRADCSHDVPPCRGDEHEVRVA